MKGRAHVVFVIACGVAIASRASAQERTTARLDFAADVAPSTCPDDAAFRERVAVRMGYDPFVDASTSRVRVRFTRRGARLVGSVDIERDGRPGGSRALEEAAGRCDVLFDAVAGTVALALDPVTRSEAPPPSNEAPPPPPSPEPAPPAPLAPASEKPNERPVEERKTTHLYTMLDGLAAVGVTPGATLGGQAGIGLRRASFVIAAEGRVEATPSDIALKSGDRVTASVFTVGVVPCLRVGITGLCLGARIGSLSASSRDVTRPALKSSFVAAGLARVTADIPIGQSGAFAFRVGAEVSVPFVRTTLSIDREAIWIAPPVNANLIAGFEWTAP